VTVRAGLVNLRTPMLWAIGAIFVLAIWGLTGIAALRASADRVLHDTYYVVAHAHYALTLAAAFGVFAGWYYAFPRITSYAYSDFLGKVHFWLWFIGANAIVPVPAGLALWAANDPEAFRLSNLMSSIGSYMLAAGILVFFANMVLSFLRRPPAN